MRCIRNYGNKEKTSVTVKTQLPFTVYFSAEDNRAGSQKILKQQNIKSTARTAYEYLTV